MRYFKTVSDPKLSDVHRIGPHLNRQRHLTNHVARMGANDAAAEDASSAHVKEIQTVQEFLEIPETSEVVTEFRTSLSELTPRIRKRPGVIPKCARKTRLNALSDS